MESRNSALRRFASGTQQQQMHAAYGQYGQMTAPPRVEPMTVDDVVVRTVGLLALTGVAGAVTWTMWAGGNEGAANALGMIGLLVGLGGILFTMFRPITGPVIPTIYAAGMGLALGGISAYMEDLYPGIVVQALLGTFGVFFGMAALYKARVIRNSPKFTKFMIGTGAGIFALLMVNMLARMFGADIGLFAQQGEDVSALNWIIAIGMVAWAAFSFILDFDLVEQGVRQGAPKQLSWSAAFGLTAGLIFLYLSILRLLDYMNR